MYHSLAVSFLAIFVTNRQPLSLPLTLARRLLTRREREREREDNTNSKKGFGRVSSWRDKVHFGHFRERETCFDTHLPLLSWPQCVEPYSVCRNIERGVFSAQLLRVTREKFLSLGCPMSFHWVSARLFRAVSWSFPAVTWSFPICH